MYMSGISEYQAKIRERPMAMVVNGDELQCVEMSSYQFV